MGIVMAGVPLGCVYSLTPRPQCAHPVHVELYLDLPLVVLCTRAGAIVPRSYSE